MATEIERRFLVFNLPNLDGITPDDILQGYLSRDKGPTVRVRQINLRDSFLAVKGPKNGASGSEFEYSIPSKDFSEMLVLCKRRTISKDRYGMTGTDGAEWDLDVFNGRHAGLAIAEIELDDPNAAFAKPNWLGPEITGDGRFSNANLAATEMDDILKWIAEYKAKWSPPSMTP